MNEKLLKSLERIDKLLGRLEQESSAIFLRKTKISMAQLLSYIIKVTKILIQLHEVYEICSKELQYELKDMKMERLINTYSKMNSGYKFIFNKILRFCVESLNAYKGNFVLPHVIENSCNEYEHKSGNRLFNKEIKDQLTKGNIKRDNSNFSVKFKSIADNRKVLQAQILKLEEKTDKFEILEAIESKEDIEKTPKISPIPSQKDIYDTSDLQQVIENVEINEEKDKVLQEFIVKAEKMKEGTKSMAHLEKEEEISSKEVSIVISEENPKENNEEALKEQAEREWKIYKGGTIYYSQKADMESHETQVFH